MISVEQLEAYQSVDIKDVDRDKLPNYDELIAQVDKKKTDKMSAILTHSDNPYIYKDMGYVVKSVFDPTSTLSYNDCTRQLVAKKAGLK